MKIFGKNRKTATLSPNNSNKTFPVEGKAEGQARDDRDRRTYNYWLAWLKKAQKQMPINNWKDAEKALRGGDKDAELLYDNGYRNQYEALKSFLDQNDPSFRVTPSKPFINDPVAVEFAKCDAAYLEYVWTEQECQIAESQKLDSTLQRNIGYTLVGFDKKKWMPTIEYLPAAQVAIDPNCDGRLKKVQAMAYWEEISLEALKSKFPDLTKDEIEEIQKGGGSILDEEEQQKLDDDVEGQLYSTIILYHIFARNDAAIRKTESEEENDLPQQSLLDELNLTTPRRYLQIVKGYHRPLVDDEGWPYDLDDDEFPITPLRFNTPTGSMYGFTDYKQMARIDKMCNNICRDMEKAAYRAGTKKYVGGPSAADVKQEDIAAFLIDPQVCYLPNMLDSEGNPKIQEVKTGEFDGDLVKAYEIAKETRKEASMLGELLSGDIGEYKDVTAFGVRAHEANLHQKINRRLGGPEGYEKSIAEDAIKILEIAHQRVPKLSLLEIEAPRFAANELGELIQTNETELKLVSVPWEQAQLMLAQPGAKLIKLGIDAIVGQELAQYWRTTEEYPVRLFKLTTKISVLPGSTRSITKEHKAAILKQYLLEVFTPLYEALGRWDLYALFALRIGQLADIKQIDDLLPDSAEIRQFMMQRQQMQAQQMQQEAEVAEIEKVKAISEIQNSEKEATKSAA